MKIYRSYKFKMAPTAAQSEAFSRNVGVCRLVYNLALEQRRDHHRQFRSAKGVGISFLSQSRELTQLRTEFDWMREAIHCCQQQALRDLDRAFQNFFKGLAAYPTPRKKGINDSICFQGRDIVIRRLNKSWGAVRLPKVGEVRFRWTRDIVGDIRNATVCLDPLGWHISFSAEVEIAIVENDLPGVGIDRGIVKALAYSDGTFGTFPKESLKHLDRIARKHARALSLKKIGSRRRSAAKRRLAAIKAKAARVRKHFNHVETARLAKSFGIICIEDLKTKNLTGSAKGTIADPGVKVRQKAGLNRSILEIGWFQFEQFITYKVAASGGEVRKVNPAYTSATCSCCGVIEKTNRKSQAVYECADCGSVMNADTNAAINILRAGTRPSWNRVADPRQSQLEAA